MNRHSHPVAPERLIDAPIDAFDEASFISGAVILVDGGAGSRAA